MLCSNARSRRTASRPKQSKGQVIAVLPVVVRGELDIVLKGTPDGAERILVLGGAQDWGTHAAPAHMQHHTHASRHPIISARK